jgi:uncharacterized protein
MNIKIAGASGYIGNIVSNKYKSDGHHVEAIGRELLYGKKDELTDYIKDADVVINLAGASIFKRWNKNNKREIYESRVTTTKNIVDAINKLPPGAQLSKVIAISATGIYLSGKVHNEQSRDYDRGFPGKIVRAWEDAWEGLPKNITLTIFRSAPVIGKGSPVIRKLNLPFKLGIGGKIGTGIQPFPFIHEQDLARAFSFVLLSSTQNKIFNLAAPQEITNAYFTKILAKKLHRPAIIPIPAFALKIIFGESSVMLTESPSIIPEALESAGFSFNYPTIESALEEIYG